MTSQPGPSREMESNEDELMLKPWWTGNRELGLSDFTPREGNFEDNEQFTQAKAEFVQNNRLQQVNRLRSVLNCFPGDQWEKVCAFFHHDLSSRDVSERCVQIPAGFGRRVTPVEAIIIWDALRKCHDSAGSVFLAHDEMIGDRMTIAFAMHHIQHQFNQMWSEIEESRREVGDRYGREGSVFECPLSATMRDRYGFECPCGVCMKTEWLKAKGGVSLAIVPPHLLEAWTTMHTRCFPPHETTLPEARQTLIVAHETAEETSEDVWAGVKAQMVSVPVHRSSGDGRNRAQQKEQASARLENSRMFVITTPDATRSHFVKRFEGRHIVTHQRPKETWLNPETGRQESYRPTPWQEKQVWNTAVVAFVFRDEFLHQRTVGRQVCEAIKKWQARTMPFFVFISEAPILDGPEDIVPEICLMYRSSWDGDAELGGWGTWEEGSTMVGILREWATLSSLSMGLEQHRLLNTIWFTVFCLLDRLMIRGTVDSTLFGRVIVSRPMNVYSEMRCQFRDTGKYWVEQVEYAEFRESEQRPGKVAKKNSFLKARLATSFPFLAATMLSDAAYQPPWTMEDFLRLTETDEQRQMLLEGVVDISENLPEPGGWFIRNLESIAESSTKLETIQGIMEKWNRVSDDSGALHQQVYVSHLFIGAYITYLWMVRVLKIPREKIVFLHEALNKDERETQWDKWEGRWNSTTPSNQRHPAQYMIATTGELLFKRPCKQTVQITFLEPGRYGSCLAEIFGLHCRWGSRFKEVYSTVLLMAYDNGEKARMVCSGIRGLVRRAGEEACPMEMGGMEDRIGGAGEEGDRVLDASSREEE